MYNIRWATDKDVLGIASLEETTYGIEGYDKKDIDKIRRGKQTTIMVCDDNNGNIMGYVIYTLSANKIYLIRLVVDPILMQHGIGSAFMVKLKDKMREDRNSIQCELEDDNLVGHKFLQKHGFKATKVLWGNGTENDLYIFEYNGNVSSNLP